MSIRQCRRAVINLDKIVNPKHKLTLRDFKPKTDFNIELLVGVHEFRNIMCQTPFVTRSFEAFVCKAITRFTYENFWPIVAQFEGDKVGGNGDRIVDKETIKDVSLMFKFCSVYFLFQCYSIVMFFFFIFFSSSSSAYIYKYIHIDDAWSTNEAVCGRFCVRRVSGSQVTIIRVLEHQKTPLLFECECIIFLF